MEIWHFLVVLGIIAFIIEIFTAGFIAGSAGIGFLFAALGSWLNMGAFWILLMFSLGVLTTFFFIRPLMLKYGHKEKIKTNRDALFEKTGIVTEEIDKNKNTGRVKIDGDDWKAVSKNNEIIKQGTAVRVVSIDSIILIVEPVNQ
ncbi:MAG: NfeD family protein [Chlorobi bacterium]|nr:NfeD family protein [Chlorobiota bacterium]